MEMLTNGTVVPSDTMCQFLHDKKIYVFLDDYRLALPDSENNMKLYIISLRMIRLTSVIIIWIGGFACIQLNLNNQIRNNKVHQFEE